MNPGPYGMAQTGVPFGKSYRSELAVDRRTGGQTRAGTSQTPGDRIRLRTPEVSGRRLWGFSRARSETRTNCETLRGQLLPVGLMTGANLTPDKLPRTVWSGTAV